MTEQKTVTENRMFDGHAHVFTTHLPMLDGRRYTPTQEAYPETYCDLLKENGLSGALLVQPSFLGTDNRYLLNVLRQTQFQENDLHIRGVVVLDPETPREPMEAMKADGIVGVRLNCFQRPVPDLTSTQWNRFLQHVEALNWHIELHIEGPRLDAILKLLCQRISTVVVDHFGLPNGDLSPALLNPPHDGVYVKCSAPYRVFPNLSAEQAARKCEPYIQALIDFHGQNRLIWGSDWPWTQHNKGQSYADTILWWKRWVSHINEASSFAGPFWL